MLKRPMTRSKRRVLTGHAFCAEALDGCPGVNTDSAIGMPPFFLLTCLAELARFLTVSFIEITENLSALSVIRKRMRASLELLVAADVPHPLRDRMRSHHDQARMDQRQGRTSRRDR